MAHATHRRIAPAKDAPGFQARDDLPDTGLPDAQSVAEFRNRDLWSRGDDVQSLTLARAEATSGQPVT